MKYEAIMESIDIVRRNPHYMLSGVRIHSIKGLCIEIRTRRNPGFFMQFGADEELERIVLRTDTIEMEIPADSISLQSKDLIIEGCILITVFKEKVKMVEMYIPLRSEENDEPIYDKVL